jgi:peptidylprolyl isomerase
MIDRIRTHRLRSARPAPEILEDWRLLTAALAPIANLTVPAQQGYTLPLDGSGTTDAQDFAITRVSGSPDITASIAPPGVFWTIDVKYTDPADSADNFSGALVFQLFQGLTPNTVSMIQQFTTDGYYTGKDFFRVATGFPGATDYVVQAGSPTSNLTGKSGQPGTPFANENVQQLAFTGTDQLGMANAGGTDSNDTQFFITTGSPDAELGYNYTIFGQLIAGQDILAKMTQIPVESNTAIGGEESLPLYPPVMSTVSLSSTNPSGVAIIDTTQARPGDTATFQVTATDPLGGPPVVRTFTVTAGAYAGPTDPVTNFRPLANPVVTTVTEGGAAPITLPGQDGYPDLSKAIGLSFTLVSPPSHGTISDLNAALGTFVYTPDPGFTGTDSFQYRVMEIGPTFGLTPLSSDPNTVTVTVAPAPLVTLARVTDVMNKRHRVIAIELTFSGALDPSDAADKEEYRLTERGRHGRFVRTKATTIKLESAGYDTTSDTVTLIPRKPFALSKPVELVVMGEPPSGLHDSLGRLIDGNDGGRPGGDAIAILSKHGVIVFHGAPPPAAVAGPAVATANAIDILLAQSREDELVHDQAVAWLIPGKKARPS